MIARAATAANDSQSVKPTNAHHGDPTYSSYKYDEGYEKDTRHHKSASYTHHNTHKHRGG